MSYTADMNVAFEIVHKNVTPSRFAEYVRRLGEVRFVIDKNGRIHLGAACNFIHSRIGSEVGLSYEDRIINGYARLSDEGELEYFVAYSGLPIDRDKVTHPLFERFERLKFKRVYEAFDFCW